MSLRDAKTQRVLIAAVLSGVALWAYFVSSLLPFGYQARTKRAKELRAQQESASAELEKARRTVSNLPQLEAEQKELERKWRHAEKLLPTTKEMPELLTEMTQAGEQAGVEFKLFRPEAGKPQEFYNENPVQVQVKGGFHQVGVFLSRLANLSRIVNVTELHMAGTDQKPRPKGRRNRGAEQQPRPEDRERTDHTLTATFTATAYSLRDPNEPPPAVAAPAEKGAQRTVKNQAKQPKRAPAHGGKAPKPTEGEQ
jgi:type IV pilus assembly protein PilO